MNPKRVVIPLNDIPGNQSACARFIAQQPDPSSFLSLLSHQPWNQLSSQDFIRSGMATGYQWGRLYCFSWGFIHEQRDEEQGTWLWEFCFPDLLSLYLDQHLTATHLHNIAYYRLNQELPEQTCLSLPALWNPQQWSFFPTGILGAFTLVSPLSAEHQARTFIGSFLQTEFINTFIDNALFYGADSELLAARPKTACFH